MKSKTETLHFSVEGEFLTNHCRTLWVEGRLSLALDTMESSGCPERYWIDVLTGKRKMVGVNTLNLEDDDAKEVYQITLKLEDVIERCEIQYAKLQVQFINAHTRREYWPMRMDAEGVTYKTGKGGWFHTHHSSFDRDTHILERALRDLRELDPLMDYLYPLVNKEMYDFPYHLISDDIIEVDEEHPNWLPNLRKKAFKARTMRDIFEDENGKYDKMLEDFDDNIPVKEVIKEVYIEKPIEVEFEMMHNPWENTTDFSNGDLIDYELEEKIPSNYGEGIIFVHRDTAYKTYVKKTPREVTLEISSWIGISSEAIHYYGKLCFWGVDAKRRKDDNSSFSSTNIPHTRHVSVKLNVEVNQLDKRTWPKRYEGYSVGSWINAFHKKEDVIKRGKEIFEKHFIGDWKLVIEDS